LRQANIASTAGNPVITINIRGANRLYLGALVELDNGAAKESFTVDGIEGDQVTLSADLANVYHEGHVLRIVEAETIVRHFNNGLLEAEEVYPALRLTGDGTLSDLVTHINERSALVTVTADDNFEFKDLAKFPTTTGGGWLDLTGGDDALSDLKVDDFVGQDAGSGKRTGIAAMEDIDEISICMVPGIWSPVVQNALTLHCELLKDRFAIIDPKPDLSLEKIQEARAPIDTKYAALYYPWLVVRDPLAGRNTAVAPSAHLAGIYARVDVERGVHKAPANEVVRGIIGFNQDINAREQDLLNPKGINALRFFPGRGNRVWGARCLTSDSAWKYINVRRLFIFVEESLDEGSQWVVFEPNDEPLWARVRQSFTNFLTTVWRSGALQGSSSDEAFFVKVDRSTMTQDDIDNGRLIIIVGIAPVKPAEFVIIRIQQKTLDSADS
jgi:hypothetical protein